MEHLMAGGWGFKWPHHCHFLSGYFIGFRLQSSYAPPLLQIFTDLLLDKCLKSSLGRWQVRWGGWGLKHDLNLVQHSVTMAIRQTHTSC